ncbi:MAG: VWA domain-containing protein, partial [Candidatus Zixiibacteriota bacterium]
TVSEEDIGFNLLPFEDEDHQGYFLAMISPQVEVAADRTSSKNIIFILDTSGSMKGEKIRQAKGALSFCLNSLNEGDRFNVIDFDDQVTTLQRGLVWAGRENLREALSFVDKREAEGGTNINDALLTGLEQIERADGASFIIFLTDGLPTVGQTDINTILANVKGANRSSIRIFVFGVGYDVNTRLLDRLAQDNHATSDYVRPSEDIEVKVSGFFKKVSHPILTDIKLSFPGVDVYNLYPKELPDIFKGSQVLVLGKYKGGGTTKAALSGSAQGSDRRFRYEVNFTPDHRNDFIPRLWATRRIGYLIDELRLHGQNKELVDEVVRLSKKYGIITEYTSFLVDADYRLALRDLAPTAEKKLKAGLKEQVGAGAVNRAMVQKDVTAAVRTQRGYVDAEGTEPRVTRMAQIGNRTFFKKDGLWVDSQYEGKIEAIKIKGLSEAYFKLLSEVPEIGRFLALGDEVIFLLHGKAIQVSDEGKSNLTAAELKSLVGR